MTARSDGDEMQVVRLDSDSVRDIADRVAELLDGGPPERPAGPGRHLTAAQVAAWWGVDRGWVYANAERLGAMRLGSGARPRLRFDPARVGEALGQRPDRALQAATRPRRRMPRDHR